MFDQLRKNWDQFINSKSGQRFRERYYRRSEHKTESTLLKKNTDRNYRRHNYSDRHCTVIHSRSRLADHFSGRRFNRRRIFTHCQVS